MLLLDKESHEHLDFVESVDKNPEAILPIAILIAEWFKNKEFQQCIDDYSHRKHPEAVNESRDGDRIYLLMGGVGNV